MHSNKNILYTDIAIIGSGPAAVSAAEACRKADSRFKISILTDESYPAYYRTRLCELLSGAVKQEDLYLRSDKWYTDMNIDIMLNTRVLSLDPKKNMIKTEKGTHISYLKLIIATGSICYIPPVKSDTCQGIYSIRKLDDIKLINTFLDKAENMVVVGGGLLGLETAYNLNKRGIHTTILEYFPCLLKSQLDESGSEILRKKVESLGIDVVTGVTVESIQDNIAAKQVTLNTGLTINTDGVIFAAGIRPCIDFVKGTDIKINKGILADGFMKTSADNIFAAGDAAEYNGTIPGLWITALNQGRAAGHNAAMELAPGADAKFMEYIPEITPYYLNSMDTKVYCIGDIASFISGNCKTIVQKQDENFVYKKLFFDDNGVIIGFILIGDISLSAKLNNCIRKKSNIDDLKKIGLIEESIL